MQAQHREYPPRWMYPWLLDWLVAPAVAAMIPVGIKEIAERLNVERGTVDKWRERNLLPEPRFVVGGRPAWNWQDIKRWARKTGRL